MNKSITIEHFLPSFSVTKEPELKEGNDKKPIYIIEGKSTLEMNDVCPKCGKDLYNHGSVTKQIEDLEILGVMTKFLVSLKRKRCLNCGYIEQQEIAFESKGHRVTTRLEKKVIVRCNNGDTITSVSKALSLHPNTVYKIDLDNLKEKFKDRKVKKATFIGIDEFKLHDGHKYATVVVDLLTGEVIFLEEGKKKEQAYHFFDEMGEEWMRGVKAVSMDMNAQYDSAFKEKYPNIDIVYDYFHPIKLFNDSVITKVRRRLQEWCKAHGKDNEYAILKNSRFIITSRLSTLEKKERLARENNQYLHDQFLMKRKELPPGERRMRTDYLKKLDEILMHKPRTTNGLFPWRTT